MQGVNDKKKHVLKSLNHINKAYFVIAIVVFLVAGACSILVGSFKSQLYKQRSYSLEQTSEKIVQIMENVIDNEWERLTLVSYELGRDKQEDTEGLLKRLDDFYKINSKEHTWMVSCIDSNGNTYQWNGRVGRWYLPAMLLSDKPTYQLSIIDSPDSAGEQMAFLYRLPETIKLLNENIELTHSLLYLDMATFGESLDVTSFEGNSFSYITEKNGSRLYHQQNQNEFISAYNILSAIKNSTFLFGESYEQLLANCDTNTPYIAEIEYEDKRYFVSYSPLAVNDWSLFLFVPESYIGGETANLIGSILLQVSLIALLLILMISIFVWTNTRQTLLKQQLAVDEANQASLAKSNFLSHMSHDIRTPLNGIIGMCHIAEQKKDDKEALSDCLEKINLSSHQLMILINDVLDMSRIEQDKVEIRKATVDLNDLVKTCSVHVEVLINEKEITFEVDTTGIIHPLVISDEILIEKILTNILGNAVKFTPEGGKITLHISESIESEEKGNYKFVIKDTGIGMSSEFIKHLFEPFSQESTGSRTKYQGTGLGLAIVKNLVDKFEGTVDVESKLNEGSTFTVVLPLTYSNDESYIAEKQNIQPFDGTGMNALLVEDNVLNQIIAKSLLEECKLKVDVVENGALAVEKFNNSKIDEYDVIFMDVRMPVMDGLEATKCIRALNRKDASKIVIIALSADAFIEDMGKSVQAGMNDHLGKPIDIQKLHALLRKYLLKDKKS